MKNKVATLMAVALGVFFGLAAFSLPLYAHHGTAEYDNNNRMTLKGTITNFDWSNPHTQVHFDVVDAKGNVVHWNLECQPPSILRHAGWSKDTLKPGDKVTITLTPAKNGTPVGLLGSVILPNGQEITPREK